MSGSRVARHSGWIGEELAAQYLGSLGWRVIEKNYRAGRYEIDLICRDETDLVFVEVKTRRSIAFGSPEDAVSHRQQAALGYAAAWYIQRSVPELLPSRFDVVAVVESPDSFTIRHVRHAFTP